MNTNRGYAEYSDRCAPQGPGRKRIATKEIWVGHEEELSNQGVVKLWSRLAGEVVGSPSVVVVFWGGC